jgi:hypothetical protein
LRLAYSSVIYCSHDFSTSPIRRSAKVSVEIQQHGREVCKNRADYRCEDKKSLSPFGCRNLRRLGVHEKTIMKIGVWKTRSVFDRYNIVDEKDLAEAAALFDVKGSPPKAQKRELRHSSDTVSPKPTRAEASINTTKSTV